MISKKMIVVSVCVMLLFTGCSYDAGEEHAGASDAVSMGEMGETAEENNGITEENIDMSNEVTGETEESVPEIHYYEQNDAYKLFYGTWEITEIASKHRQPEGDEDCEDILGMQVTYLPDRYEFGGIVTVDHPNYLISIFPRGSTLIGGLKQAAVGEDTLKLPDNGVFVWVQIVDLPIGIEDGRSYGFEAYVGSEFFIKDDNTLYCFNYECFYEMKRVSYDEVSEEAAESLPRREHHYEQNDAYKLFYGTWEITGIVSESRYLGGDEGCEDILGMQITYLPGVYIFGEIVKLYRPNYLISILPTDSRLLFDQRQVSMDTLLPDSEYSVWVQMVNMPVVIESGTSYGFEPYVGREFLIKDDNTLYIFAYNCVYEMTRVSYMDDYDSSYTLSYRERD